MYLATGHTIYCKSIKAATIEEYLKAAAGLIKKLDPVDGRDAMYDRDGVKYIGITSVLREVRRIEKVPNRRENYSIAMHFRLYERQKMAGEDSLIRVMYNWFTTGLQFGNRRSEWCQPDGAGLLHKVQMCAFGRATAFIFEDIRFFTGSKIELSIETALQNEEAVFIIRVRFMWQKNLQHNIHRWAYRNNARPFLCAVRAWIAIVRRFIRLMGRDSDKPLAVYRTKLYQTRLVTSDDATRVLRDLAVDVYKLTKKEDTQKFSSHSLRVGACCILFATGYPPDFIQRVLRWDSDAWRKYVRDLVVTAMQVNVAMNKAHEMPLM